MLKLQHTDSSYKKKKNIFRLNQFPNVFVFFAKTRYTAWCLPYLYMPFGATWHLPVPVKAVEFVCFFLGSLLLGEDEGFFCFVEMVFFQLFFWLLSFFPHCQLFCFFFWETGEGFFFFFWQHVLDHFNSLFFCTIQSKAKNLEAKLSYKSLKLIHKIFTHKRLNQST